MATPQEKDNVYHGLLKQNRMFRLNETTELSMEEIHHPVLPFVRGTRNLWRQGQYWIERGAGDQEHLRKISIVFHKPLLALLGSPSALLPESCNYRVQQCTRSSTRTYTCIATVNMARNRVLTSCPSCN
ncbi:uncharacterized protein LOC119590850 [Penaeus monodon]|uniref:uncharacterized protein LOC119590850 n=1 Tax=Penaeus monodon TaxID=6687 RepID=UPI0018A709A6|nr:uncharacterized protein LOC119590850 [Penaeus monodon]